MDGRHFMMGWDGIPRPVPFNMGIPGPLIPMIVLGVFLVKQKSRHHVPLCRVINTGTGIYIRKIYVNTATALCFQHRIATINTDSVKYSERQAANRGDEQHPYLTDRDNNYCAFNATATSISYAPHQSICVHVNTLLIVTEYNRHNST